MLAIVLRMSYFHIIILSYLYTFDEVLGHFALEPNERWSSGIVDLLGGSFYWILNYLPLQSSPGPNQIQETDETNIFLENQQNFQIFC